MSNKGIPKTIHYCWFGGGEMPDQGKLCIDSWRSYCPGYEIIEWNESNFDVNVSKFSKEAYKAEKWAFVSDYVRMYVLYNYGGVYLDTDVELIKNLDTLLENRAFFGFEGREYVNSGLGFGAVKGHGILSEMLAKYESIDFNEVRDCVETISAPILLTEVLNRHGLIKNGELQELADGVVIYPEDFFCPKNPITRLININSNTFSIHHYEASWVDTDEKNHIEELERKANLLMQSQSQKVSIIIPVYNGENYLKEAIDSALNQTYKNIEVIVVNDGSSDGSEQIAKTYGNQIRYFKKENGGVASALNLGIEKMRGYYFSWLSHDDKYHPEKIEKQVAVAEKYDDETIIVCNWTIIDENGEFVQNKVLDKKLESLAACFLAFDRKTWLNGCSMLIPRELFSKYGSFDESLRTTQDYDMWFRLSRVVDFIVLEDHLMYSRAHGKQGSLSLPEALENSDNIHYNIIRSLTEIEVEQYFESNESNYLNSYNNFYNSGYKKAPALIMRLLTIFLFKKSKNSDAFELIEKEILGFASISYFNKQKLTVDIPKAKERTRLMFFTAHWYTGGVERFLSNLLVFLSKHYDIYLISVETDIASSIKIPSEITHIKVSHQVFVHNYDYALYAMSTILNIDIAIGCINLFDKVLDFYKLSSGSIKTIASNHEYFFFPYETEYFYPMVNKRLESYKHVDAAIWLTSFSTMVYNNYNENGLLIANPNTYNIMDNSINYKDEKIVLCVGRFNDYVKRIDRILACFGKVLTQIPDAKLMLVGKYNRDAGYMSGSKRTINDLIEEMNIPKQSIYFEGESKDIERYYSVASVLLLTSNSEGFPMIINEAACFGVPTVCNYIPGIEDIITDGENGYLVPQNDIETLAGKVCMILLDNELRIDMGEKSKKTAARFEIEVIGSKWVNLIEEVLSDKPHKDKLHTLSERLNSPIKTQDSAIKGLCEEITKIFDAFQDVRRHDKIICNTNYISEACTEVSQNKEGATVVFKPKSRFTIYFDLVLESYQRDGFRATVQRIIKNLKRKITKT